MTHRYTLEAVERSVRDLCNRNQIFGGKNGNFRQILHVITRKIEKILLHFQYQGQDFGLIVMFNILEPICDSCIQI